jgi:hypothetical protein
MQRQSFGTGALGITRVLERIAERAELPLEWSGRGAGAILGGLSDINGSIRLSDQLDEAALRGMPEMTDEPQSLLDAVEPLRDRVEGRVRAIRRLISRRYASVFEGKDAVLDAGETLAALADTGALTDRKKKTTLYAARAISSVHRTIFDRAVKSSRAELMFLRKDLEPDLRALGPVAVELERLDASITRATVMAVRAAMEDLHAAVMATFDEAIANAILALPKGGADDEAVIEAVAAWLAPDGLVRLHVSDCEALALGLFDREAEILTSLVNAACDSAAAEGAV